MTSLFQMTRFPGAMNKRPQVGGYGLGKNGMTFSADPYSAPLPTKQAPVAGPGYTPMPTPSQPNPATGRYPSTGVSQPVDPSQMMYAGGSPTFNESMPGGGAEMSTPDPVPTRMPPVAGPGATLPNGMPVPPSTDWAPPPGGYSATSNPVGAEQAAYVNAIRAQRGKAPMTEIAPGVYRRPEGLAAQEQRMAGRIGENGQAMNPTPGLKPPGSEAYGGSWEMALRSGDMNAARSILSGLDPMTAQTVLQRLMAPNNFGGQGAFGGSQNDPYRQQQIDFLRSYLGQ